METASLGYPGVVQIGLTSVYRVHSTCLVHFVFMISAFQLFSILYDGQLRDTDSVSNVIAQLTDIDYAVLLMLE